jgi:hypothetical protein
MVEEFESESCGGDFLGGEVAIAEGLGAGDVGLLLLLVVFGSSVGRDD